ncbi:coiled-coil domain-containing protein [Wansuia hejianensis]|uniref:Uncharacterized protein n=1 Tax=Wansuia hejianensis TaxID=2763667 RepID=A0A7G9GBW8_9FIRM|nr:hypothetical protein [Wansuia hejianensis]QNM08300.1 hypothetical protein H9Q79_15660 [Wansuia hejianensis]
MLRHSKSKGIVVFLVLFLCGYGFFFSSNLWMPVSGNANKLTKFNQPMEFNNRTVTLLRWDYSETEHKMEVELEVENPTFDGINTYEYCAIDASNSKLNVVPILQDPDYVVLQLENVPKRWSEVSLRMGLPEESEDATNTVILRMYTNVRDVQRVNSLEPKSRNDYLIQRMDLQIAYYEEEIQALEQTIHEQEEYQKNAQEEIKRLTDNKKFQTEEEIEETDRLIQTAEQKQEASEELVQQNKDEIKEYQKKIEKTNEKKALFRDQEG